MQLTKFLTTNHDDQNLRGIQLTVDFNPETRTVDGIIDVSAFDFISRVNLSLTEVFVHQFPDELDSMVNKVDWYEIYYILHKSHTTKAA